LSRDESKDEPQDESKDGPRDEPRDESKDEPRDESKDEPRDESKDEPREEYKDESKDEQTRAWTDTMDVTQDWFNPMHDGMKDYLHKSLPIMLQLIQLRMLQTAYQLTGI
jgi:hypothetical protein